MTNAYINAASAFLPGPAIDNTQMAAHLGVLDDQSTRLGRLILRQNRISQRYYVPKVAGRYEYNNADMAALAVREVLGKGGVNPRDLSLLTTATTQGDLLVPGHGSAVHAALAKLVPVGGLEVASFQSVCASSMMATKTAALNVQAGQVDHAVAVGSEFSSRWFQPGFYDHAQTVLADKEARMSAEFLRWTLSDGAGAILIEPKPSVHKQAFRIDWIDLVSLADRFDTCMFAGVSPEERFALTKPWSQYEAGPRAAVEDAAVMLMQDMVLLKRIIRAWIGEYLARIDEGKLDPARVDHLLCHYSAHSLREEIISVLKSTGGMIDEEKWFSNLATKGNTGSAAFFIMLDEFAESGLAKPGDQVFCIIPESGRAMISFMMLTAL